MHILAVEQQPTEFAGGQERSLYEVLKRLKDQDGVKLSLCWQEYGELLEQYREWTHHDTQIRFRVFSSGRMLVMLKDVLKLYWGFITKKWDVVYCNQYFDLPIFTLLSRLTSVKLTCHLRLMCPHYLSHQYRWGLMNAHVLIANSEAVKQSYVAAGIPEEKFQVIHNKIDIRNWKPELDTPQNETPVIAYFGRLCKEKGILDLIDAFALMKTDAKLMLYGNVRGAGTDDSFIKECHQRATETNRQTNIVFHPHTDQVQKVMQKCDLIVLPSWEESFGRVLIEAMALEIPVVATRVGGVPEVLFGDFEDHLCEAQNPEMLAEKLDQFAGWRKHQPELGMNSRKHVIDYFSDYNLGTEIRNALETAL